MYNARNGAYDMTTIAVPLSEEQVEQLRQRAKQAGIAPEEFLRRSVEQILDQPEEAFREAAAYVMKKNAELYRRLS